MKDLKWLEEILKERVAESKENTKNSGKDLTAKGIYTGMDIAYGSSLSLVQYLIKTKHL